VTAGAPRSPDAVVTMKPDLLYALASRRKTPQFALERVEVEGDAAVAEQVLEALSGAAG
jgi:ubiquinone biosynthesis protein UbiJ